MRAGAGLLRTKGGGEQCAAPGQGDFKLVHPTHPSLGQGEGGGDARSALGPAQLCPALPSSDTNQKLQVLHFAAWSGLTLTAQL